MFGNIQLMFILSILYQPVLQSSGCQMSNYKVKLANKIHVNYLYCAVCVGGTPRTL